MLPRAVTATAVAVAVLPRLNWVLPNEDGGAVGAWAMQMAAGGVPYRDFFVFTTPGSVLLYAALFKVTGSGYLAARALTGAAIVLSAVVLLEIGRELLAPLAAAAVAVLWGTWLGVDLQFGPHHFWGAACLLLMALAVLRRRFAWAGAAAALAVAFIQAAAPAVLAALAAAWLVQPSWRRTLLPMSAAGVAATLPWAAWLALSGAFPGFWDDAVVFPLRDYPATNSLPFPLLPTDLRDAITFESSAAGVWMLLFGWFLTVLAPVAIAAAALWRLVRSRGGPPEPWVVIAVLSTGLFTVALASRLTAPLGWFAAPLALVLVAAWVTRATAGRPAALLPAAAVLATGLAPVPVGYVLSCELNAHGPWVVAESPGGEVCLHRSYAAPMEAALDFVAAHPHDRVAFLPVASSFYLFTGETPPVSTVWVIPGLETPRLSSALDGDLARGRARYVVYYEADLRTEMPSDSALFATGPSWFDRELDRYYRRVEDVDVGGSPLWAWSGP